MKFHLLPLYSSLQLKNDMTKSSVQKQITGKRGEYRVVGKLMESGFTVYVPILDIEGIDCIIKNDTGRLIEIQIKTRNKKDSNNRQFKLRSLKPHQDLFICCYFIDTDELWAIPSIQFDKIAYRNKYGERAIHMTSDTQTKIAKYKDRRGLDLLRLPYYKNKLL